MKGTVFGVQHFSLEDGPGIRTTIFLKGCNMRCPWCHNPESWKRTPEIVYRADRCIQCTRCVDACPNHCHSIDLGRHVFHNSDCTACARCVDVCSSGALSRTGYEGSVQEILEEVARDRRYYEVSGGGLTLSGGEPACQAEFSAELVSGAHALGLNCAVETNASGSYDFYAELLDAEPLFLTDYKLTNANDHLQMTGVEKTVVVSNISQMAEDGARVVITCPIIPGINDNEEHFAAIAALSRSHNNILGFFLRPYHALGRSKASQLNRSQAVYPVPSDQEAAAWKARICHLGGKEYACSHE